MNWQEAGSWVWYFCCLGSSWLEDIDIVFQSLLPSHTQTEFPWNYFPNIVVPKRHVWLCLCRILKWKSVFFCLYIYEIPSQCYAMMGCQNLNILLETKIELCWLEGQATILAENCLNLQVWRSIGGNQHWVKSECYLSAQCASLITNFCSLPTMSTSFTHFGRSGRVTYATVRWWDSA